MNCTVRGLAAASVFVPILAPQAAFAQSVAIAHPDVHGMSERMEWPPRVDAKTLVKEMSVVE